MTTTQVSYLMEKLDKIADDVSDVRERVTRLEANDELRLRSLTRIQWGLGLAFTSLIGGVPVLFLVWDRLTN
jgi:hypothetical protein